MGPHVRTSREVQGLVTRVRPGVTRHAPHLPDIVLSVMGLVEVEQVLVEGSVDMAMDQDAGMTGDLMAIMGASIMGAVFQTADMDRIVILATTANTIMVSSLGPWPVSSMEGRHQRRRIV